MREITDEKLSKYFAVTGKAIEKVKITEKDPKMGEDFFDMAKRYYSDAEYFREEGDYVNAFAAVAYAHGWLDAGARSGLFDVGGDSTLFTVE